jgi:hypothetical protein
MTNPGEDAGQSASSGSDAGGSEPSSTSYEAPPIEQSQGPVGQSPDEATAVYRTPSLDQPAPTPEPPAYTPPPAYDPSGYQSPPPYEPTPNYPQGGFPPPGDQSGFPPPVPPSYSPPPQYGNAGGFGAPGYPPPPPYGAPPPGFGAPPPGFGPPPGYPAPGYNAYGQPPAQKTNTMAIGSLVASVVGVCCGIGSIIGIVLGVLSMNQIKKTGENGNGLAIAGIAVGILTLLINVAWTIGTFAS